MAWTRVLLHLMFAALEFFALSSPGIFLPWPTFPLLVVDLGWVQEV